MQCFKNILVGVDLTRCRRLDVSEIAPDAREVIDHAVWLAKVNGARLLFFAALNVSQDALRQLQQEEHSHVKRTVEELADRALADLVRQAEQRGVEARARLVLGTAWLEIIRQVLRGRHDLIVVGTRDRSGLRRMLFGSTSVKLLRRCPCPVWVVKPGHGGRPLNTLVATALRPGATALRLGVAVGSQMLQPVHVLHVVEYPLDYLWGTAYPDRGTTEYHRKVRADAEKAMRERLREANPEAAGVNVQVHLAEGVGVPDVAIQQFIAEHAIDLLVMGTVGRGGMEGILIGNTAERLLPEVDCSVLAVKPPDFVSPVKLDAAEVAPGQ
jgi:universal stress protein E